MKSIFAGAATAIITPFGNDNTIDYKSFDALLNWQIENSIDAIVVAGTTGESATLTTNEHKDLIKHCVKTVDGRVPVIAGTGSNNTAHSIELTKFAGSVGVDGVLLVTPYYNKATQSGLLEHYTTIMDASIVPAILYNVPSRTGCNIEPETLDQLCNHPRMAGIKEASGDISQVAKIAELCGDKISVYSGNDDQIVPMMSLGAKGVISVLSNLLPKETHDICRLYSMGKTNESLNLQLRYLNLINLLFSEVNPIPIKAAMSLMGKCGPYLRLPLTNMSQSNLAMLKKQMQIFKLI